MKRFLLKLLIFVLPFLITYPFLEYQLKILPNSYNPKREYLESQLNEIKIISTGSSHGNSINPLFFEQKGFNISQNSQDLYYDTKLVEKYLDKLPELKLIIMPISYFSMEVQIDHSPQSWRGPFHKLIWGIPTQSLSSQLNISNFSFTAAYGWYTVANYIISGDDHGILRDEPQQIKNNGWRDVGNQEIQENSEEERSGWQSVSINESTMHPENIKVNMDLLSELIEKCQSHGVQIVFITTPVYHYYYEHIDPFKYKRMQEMINYLVSKYHIFYFNYLKDARFINSDFFNRDHLNSNGAEKFTKIINDDFIRAYFKE